MKWAILESEANESNSELEEQGVYMNNTNCETLKKFLESEVHYTPKEQCETCKKKKCSECEALNDKYSAEDSRIFKSL